LSREGDLISEQVRIDVAAPAAGPPSGAAWWSSFDPYRWMGLVPAGCGVCAGCGWGCVVCDLLILFTAVGDRWWQVLPGGGR